MAKAADPPMSASERWAEGNERPGLSDQLAKVLRAAGGPGWRLSCLEEDWWMEADIAAIQRTAFGISARPAGQLRLGCIAAGQIADRMSVSGSALSRSFSARTCALAA